MYHLGFYNSPIGEILLASDSVGLVGAWFEGQKYYADLDLCDAVVMDDKFIISSKEWLNNYFNKTENNVNVSFHLIGTDFQKEVWNILLTIPYGKTITYGYIASFLAKNHGISKMSARAVGHAVGKNHLSIFIPCHRVVGYNGKLTGYAGGIDRKKYLLNLEKSELI